jgi:hypothetical protein
MMLLCLLQVALAIHMGMVVMVDAASIQITSPLPCTPHAANPAGLHRISLMVITTNVQLAPVPGDRKPEFCIVCDVRSAKDWNSVWQFNVPPTPHTSTISTKICGAPPGNSSTSFQLDLPAGLHEIMVHALIPDTSLAFMNSEPVHVMAGKPSSNDADFQQGLRAKELDVKTDVPKVNGQWTLREDLVRLADWQLDPALATALREAQVLGSYAPLHPVCTV